MPDENKPDGSVEEEVQSVNGVEEADSPDGGEPEVSAEADSAPAENDDAGDVGQDDIDALVAANGGGKSASVAGDGDSGENAEAAGALEEQSEDGADVQEEVIDEDPEAAMMRMLEEEGNKAGLMDDDDGGDEFPDLSGVQMEQPQANPVEFQQLSPAGGTGGDSGRNIEMLLDVKMPVSIELGRTEMPIADLLSLGPGSVVELNKLAGEPVDLLVNNVVIAKGEVVVVDENFGVRVTLLMSPEERLKSMAQQ